MKKILYIAPAHSTFVKRDIEILGRNFDVVAPLVNWSRKGRFFLNIIAQKIFLFTHLKSASAVYVMFAGYWSVLPVLFGKIYKKPVFIIAGGTDCVSFPEYNYGSLRKPLLRFMIKISFRFATRVLPVAESLVKTEYKWTKTRFRHQGYMSFFPDIKTPYSIIHNGYYPVEHELVLAGKEPFSFVTVALVTDETRFILKGGDLVIMMAQRFPEFKFTFAGVSEAMINILSPDLPGNLTLMPPLTEEEVKDLLAKQMFYLSLSISEGFPNALCEAMLAGCIPVGSDVGATSLIIGDCGKLITAKDDELIVKAIEELTSQSVSVLTRLSGEARSRILNMFPVSKREELLVRQVMPGGKPAK